MLRLWRDRVRIVLCPDRLITVHYKAGLRPRIIAKQVHRYAATGISGAGADWQAALTVLQAALGNPDWKNAEATLIISNHFVRFLLLPWNDVALTDAEKLALLQDRFAEVYGEASATWELRLHEGSFGSPSLASAVDQGLLDQLKGIFKVSGLRLKSIQPYLMTVFNACRHELDNEAAWFVLAEEGMSCIGLLRNGQWQSIRLRRTESDDELDEAMVALEREKLRADPGNQNGKVFVFDPENFEFVPTRRGTLAIHSLRPKSCALLSRQEMYGYAMAVAGM